MCVHFSSQFGGVFLIKRDSRHSQSETIYEDEFDEDFGEHLL